MDSPTLPFTEDELNKAGLLGEGVSDGAKQVLETMTRHPGLLKLSLFALQCINLGEKRMSSSSPRVPSPAGSDVTIKSSFPAHSFTSGSTVVSVHDPDEYERTSYYNCIAGNDHPDLVYRSDFLTTPFPKPVGRHAYIPVKSLRGVFDTPLNDVWEAVLPQISDLISARRIDWSSISPARFFTHAPPGEESKGSLGPVVIWVGVAPGSTSGDTAHEVSQDILALLRKNGVEDVVVEWHEAVTQRLADNAHLAGTS